MSDVDRFIEEVTDEVRRDRMFGLWKRYAPFVIGAVVAIVGATAVNSWLQHRAASQAQAAGGALIEAAAPANPEQRAASLLAFSDIAEGGVMLLGRMQAAGALAEAGDAVAAAEQFEAVAAAATDEPALAALAAYRAAILRAPAAGSGATIAALTPLTQPGNPMRLLALEARGIAHLEVGDRASARADFDLVLSDPEASDQTRARVGEFGGLLGPAAPAEG